MVGNNKKLKTTFDRIGKRWKECINNVSENEKEISEKFIPSTSFDIYHQEYHEAKKLEQKLLKKYKGKTLEHVINGNELETEKGVCYNIENQENINLKTINSDQAIKKILSDLKLIDGIEEITEHNLKANGYKTIDDLTKHPCFASKAKEILKIVYKKDSCQIVDYIRQRPFPKSRPLAFYPSGFHEKEDFIFFDIETMGFFNVPIILFGVAQISGDQILTNQYLLRDIKEEPAALLGFLSQINKNSVFITFNGLTFDIPYVKGRLAYYRMKADLEIPHFDMRHFSRRAWREKIPNCKLSTLEKYLFGVERKDDVPGALVPDFYETYMRTRNIGPIIPIIEHNKQDLISIANVFSKLHEKWS
ncbi:MAG: ribonuclease H-like domain-containing protein [Candidatus Pacebacteria bacterium]|nr:ribonuclease H-like domain-containing protein [Candidatus Paceibacterota bacterium]NKQ39889.1 exonuclease [Methanosarcinales archaeon]